MVSRTHFECEIENLVRAHDLPAILELLAFVEKEKAQGISAESIRFNLANETSESLLHVALYSQPVQLPLPDASVGAPPSESAHGKWLKVFQWLFTQLKDDEIILSLNRWERSLIWLAANHDQPEIGLMLAQHQLTQFATHERKATWLRADIQGVTPLHLAAQKPVSDFFRFLANQNNLNAITADQDTALHLACRTKQFENIGILIKQGIDIYFSNAKGENFFSYFDGFDEAEKLTVFIKLNNTAQLSILKFYRKQLADKKLAEDKYVALDALYTKLMEQRVARPYSLQALILSKMPYNPKDYFPKIYGLPDQALEVVPEYGDRVRKAERNKYSKSKFRIWWEALFTKKTPSTEKPKTAPMQFNVKNANEILEEDRAAVRQVLNKTKAYSTQLAGAPRYNYRNGWFRARLLLAGLFSLAGIGMAFFWFILVAAIFVTITTASGMAMVAAGAALPLSPYFLPLLVTLKVPAAIIGFVATGISLLIFTIVPLVLWRIRTAINPSSYKYISAKETAELAKSLQHEVVDKLDRLKKQDATSLLIPTTGYLRLKQRVAVIKKADIPVHDMSATVNVAKTILDTLLQVMSAERKSLSVTLPPEKTQAPVDLAAREVATAAPASTVSVAAATVASSASASVSPTLPIIAPVVAITPVSVPKNKTAVAASPKPSLSPIAPKTTAQASHLTLFQTLRPKPIATSKPNNPINSKVSNRGNLNA
jgi:hypothetical protein